MKGYLIGFRKWVVTNEELRPLTYDQCWSPGVNYAKCERNRNKKHEVPNEKCGCGLYAWFDFDDAIKYPSFPYRKKNCIIGAIAGAGGAQVHNKGFRASEAQIIALLVPDKFEYNHLLIGKKYNVPIFNRKEEFIQFIESFESTEAVSNFIQEKEQLEASKRTFSLFQKIGYGFLFLLINCLIMSINIFSLSFNNIISSYCFALVVSVGFVWVLCSRIKANKAKQYQEDSLESFVFLFVKIFLITQSFFWILCLVKWIMS